MVAQTLVLLLLLLLLLLTPLLLCLHKESLTTGTTSCFRST
jgi:hypothetical protein